MNTALVIFIAALITIAIVSSRLAAKASSTPKPQPQTASGASGETVANLLQAGQKIQAIKLYREQTGAGLADAKDAVEAMARGELPPLPEVRPPANSDTLENLITAGRKIEAIKVYREQTGVGLKDAKDHVEALVQQLLLR